MHSIAGHHWTDAFRRPVGDFTFSFELITLVRRDSIVVSVGSWSTPDTTCMCSAFGCTVEVLLNEYREISCLVGASNWRCEWVPMTPVVTERPPRAQESSGSG